MCKGRRQKNKPKGLVLDISRMNNDEYCEFCGLNPVKQALPPIVVALLAFGR